MITFITDFRRRQTNRIGQRVIRQIVEDQETYSPIPTPLKTSPPGAGSLIAYRSNSMPADGTPLGDRGRCCGRVCDVPSPSVLVRCQPADWPGLPKTPSLLPNTPPLPPALAVPPLPEIEPPSPPVPPLPPAVPLLKTAELLDSRELPVALRAQRTYRF